MAELRIYSAIVDEETRALNKMMFGLDGVSFQSISSAIDSIPAEDPNLDIFLNSPGGSCAEGWAMHDKLRASGKNITVTVEGESSSMSTVVLLAAPLENRKGYPNATVLIHNPYVPEGGLSGAQSAEDLQKAADHLMEERRKLIALYVERTTADEATITEAMNANKPLNMDQAKSMGFIYEIIPPSTAKNKPLKIETMSKENEKFIAKLLKKCGFSSVAEAQAKLDAVAMSLFAADGTEITLDKESGTPEVGDAATPDGIFLMPEGETIVIEAGVITEIRPAETAEPEPDPEMESLRAENAALAEAKAALEAQVIALKKTQRTVADSEVLNAVAKIGGLNNLKKAVSLYKPESTRTIQTPASTQDDFVERQRERLQSKMAKK